MKRKTRYRTKKAITLSVEPETIAAMKQLAEEYTAGNISKYVRRLIKEQMDDLEMRKHHLQLDKLMAQVA
jgi:hypothetical protein